MSPKDNSWLFMWMWVFIFHQIHVYGKYTDMLFYTTPGSSFREVADHRKFTLAGLYGGRVNHHGNGTMNYLKESGIYCASGDPSLIQGLEAECSSFDPVSMQAMLQAASPDVRATVISGPICTVGPKCDPSLTTTYLFRGGTTDETPARIGPFAMWDNVTYFIAQRYDQVNMSDYMMELRQLQGCEDQYPFTQINPLKLDNCSVLINTIISDDIGHLPKVPYKPANELYITDRGWGLEFMLQIQNYTFNNTKPDVVTDYHLILMKITETGVEELHIEEVAVKWATTAGIGNMGSIDYKNDVLCWTALEKILCADYMGSYLQNVHYVLQEGEASTVCERECFTKMAMYNRDVSIQI